MDEVLKGLNGVVSYKDDVLIGGKNLIMSRWCEGSSSKIKEMQHYLEH